VSKYHHHPLDLAASVPSLAQLPTTKASKEAHHHPGGGAPHTTTPACPAVESLKQDSTSLTTREILGKGRRRGFALVQPAVDGKEPAKKRGKTATAEVEVGDPDEWLADAAKVKAFAGKHDLRRLLDQQGGLVRIDNFLPTAVAERVLQVRHWSNQPTGSQSLQPKPASSERFRGGQEGREAASLIRMGHRMVVAHLAPTDNRGTPGSPSRGRCLGRRASVGWVACWSCPMVTVAARRWFSELP
jgi:hypothetical protein